MLKTQEREVTLPIQITSFEMDPLVVSRKCKVSKDCILLRAELYFIMSMF